MAIRDSRLLGVCEPVIGAGSQPLVERIVTAVRAFTTGAAQSDDITVMVIRYLGAGA